MYTRPLTSQDIPALDALLMREAWRNVFHLSGLAENGLSGNPQDHSGSWAVGVFRDDALAGVVIAVKGTGGIYHYPRDPAVLRSLAGVVYEKSIGGPLSLLSGHALQIDPLLPLIAAAGVGHPDRCRFCVLEPFHMRRPAHRQLPGFSAPRLATQEDMEKLIDFYQIGFYSLARLPSRAAWRDRLDEQLAHRTLFIIEDLHGRVASAALSSAEGAGAAMLGGVATRPEYTGRGLSTICVTALCEQLFASGTQVVSLFYLMNNLAAERVYEKLGFRADGEWILAPVGMGGMFA